jgi:ribosomal-protein-alanine N-acetyltransferase
MAMSGDAFPALLTRRLRLRQIVPRDADSLHACFSDRVAMRYWDAPLSASMADTTRLVDWLSKTTSPYDHLAWTIAEQSDDRCVGMVNYHHREARNRRLEIGYIIAPEFQRNGFGTEAVAAMRDYCIRDLGVHRIQAYIHPDNAASRRLVERLGFVCEGGPLSDYWCVAGRYLSAMCYAFIASGGASVPDTPAVRNRARATSTKSTKRKMK